ncbi:H4MPT-linked C1 transfer pathway protein [Archaeoglobales archaeon]|nr:MAG: H4MPT-linked C1 transfer pathway protein [Archaeoglobales archaeon]
MSFLGIDLGGANLKVVSKKGWQIIYFPIWKKFGELERLLRSIAKKHSADKAGVTMTAELSDAFRSKEEGVQKIAEVCRKVFAEAFFLNLDGRLTKEIDDPRKYAASNWVASVAFLIEDGRENFVFVDIGSTTTDIIPVTNKPKAAFTDFERLKRGELVYFGVLRTPVFYVLHEIYSAPLCPEFFSITADVFRVTGDIGEEDYTCETPDGRGKDLESCLRRLSRSICCDLDELGIEKAREIASRAKLNMILKLSEAIREKLEEYGISSVLGCGIGEFLIEESCRGIKANFTKLSEIYGDYSKLFPAYSIFKLVEKEVEE